MNHPNNFKDRARFSMRAHSSSFSRSYFFSFLISTGVAANSRGNLLAGLLASALKDKPSEGGSLPAAGFWKKAADLLAPRLGHGMAAMNGVLYIIGGGIIQNRECIGLRSVEAYGTATGGIEQKAAMPTARSSFGIEVFSERIYVIGGTPTDSRYALDTVEEYDPMRDCWAVKSPMPTARSQLGVAHASGKIYVIGGNAGHEQAFEAYDPLLDKWYKLPDMPTPRRNAAVIAHGEDIYVLGGVTPDGWTPVNLVEIYSSRTQIWKRCSSMEIARTDFALAEASGRIYAIGGWNRGPLASFEVYDIGQDKWTSKGSLLCPRQFHAAACWDGKIYLAGGTFELPEATASVQVYDANAEGRL